MFNKQDVNVYLTSIKILKDLNIFKYIKIFIFRYKDFNIFKYIFDLTFQKPFSKYLFKQFSVKYEGFFNFF